MNGTLRDYGLSLSEIAQRRLDRIRAAQNQDPDARKSGPFPQPELEDGEDSAATSTLDDRKKQKKTLRDLVE
jgi:hypothetical protein